MSLETSYYVIFLLLAAIFAYLSFLLWTPQKNINRSPNRIKAVLVGILFSVILYFIHLLGCILVSIVFTFIPIGNVLSFVFAAAGGVLLSACTIKILSQKISTLSFHYFSIIACALYLIFGILSFLALQTLSVIYAILGFSYICVSIFIVYFIKSQKHPDDSDNS